MLAVGFKNPNIEVAISTEDAARFKTSFVHNMSKQLHVGVQAEWPVKGAPAVEAAIQCNFKKKTSAGAKVNKAGHLVMSAKRITKNIEMYLQATIDGRNTAKHSAGMCLYFEMLNQAFCISKVVNSII